MIRYIRVLGAALGGARRARPRRRRGAACSPACQYSGALLAAWVVAWIVVGFAILPYLTVVPATWLIRQVEAALDGRVRRRRHRPAPRPADGSAARPAAVGPRRRPRGRWLPLGVSLFLGLGMLGLTVAKRKDLLIAAEAVGLFRRPAADAAAGASRGEPHIVVDTSAIIDGRIAEIVESGLHLRHARHPALRPRRAPAHRRQLGRAAPQPRPARPRDPEPDAEGAGHAGRDRRGRRARYRRGRRQARRARPRAQPGHPDQRLQPEPRRRAAGRPGHEHQLAGQRGQAGRAARARSSASGSSRRARRPARASASSTTAR